LVAYGDLVFDDDPAGDHFVIRFDDGVVSAVMTFRHLGGIHSMVVTPIPIDSICW